MTEIVMDDKMRLVLVEVVIAALAESEDPRAPMALETYRAQRAKILARMRAAEVAENQSAPAEVAPAVDENQPPAVVVQLRPAELYARPGKVG